MEFDNHTSTTLPESMSNLKQRRSRPRAGFTLVELLVVIGIIALLISILLPALNRARRAANTVACAANIRTILQGMQMYVSENKGYFPGGANSSGAFLIRPSSPYSDTNCPNISQIWDWQAPIGHMMGIPFNEGATLSDRQDRFQRLMDFGAFRCPENQFISTPFPATNGWPTLTMSSYYLAIIFQFTHNSVASAGDGRLIARSDWNVPDGYVPKITKIGDSSRKVYIADGARYSNSSTVPDYDTSFNGTYGGSYGDQGAFALNSNCWNRALAPGNGGSGTDARIYGFRHGTIKQKVSADQYRLNVGFFDGHVENMGDLQASDPEIWVPRGTSVAYNASQMYKDVLNTYGGAGTRTAN